VFIVDEAVHRFGNMFVSINLHCCYDDTLEGVL